MGANNWGICPKCRKEAEAEKERKAKVVGESYGQVSPEAYQELFRRASEPVKLGDTLREDYEIRTHQEGDFFVNYAASCDKCGFRFSFKHEVPDVLAVKS